MKNPILLVIGLLFAGLFGWGGVRMIRKGLERRRVARDQASRWVRVDGRVVSAVPHTISVSTYNAASHSSSTSTTYYPNVTFSFEVAGVVWTATRLLFEPGGGDPKKVERAIAERLPAGAAIPVFYDPDDPSQCVLQRERGGAADVVVGALIAAFGAVFLAMAVLGNVP